MTTDALTIARRVLRQEAAALVLLSETLDGSVAAAVDVILACQGRVLTCGIGKSGHIARKTAGTFSSTGTPSAFIHAAEAFHGDLGGVTAADVVIFYTHSGETDEIVRLIPVVRGLGAKTILITGRASSSAARLVDVVLATGVTAEACPNNLAPTTSTTAMLALSDALAVAVMETRGFGPDDFARFHPSGTLGKRLLLRVQDAMRPRDEIAVVRPDATVTVVIRAMTTDGVGAACVEDGDLCIGLITEGDLRRHLLRGIDPLAGTAADLMNRSFTSIEPELLATDAFEVFQNHPKKIGEIPVVSAGGQLVGLLVLKDLLRTGIV